MGGWMSGRSCRPTTPPDLLGNPAPHGLAYCSRSVCALVHRKKGGVRAPAAPTPPIHTGSPSSLLPSRAVCVLNFPQPSPSPQPQTYQASRSQYRASSRTELGLGLRLLHLPQHLHTRVGIHTYAYTHTYTHTPTRHPADAESSQASCPHPWPWSPSSGMDYRGRQGDASGAQWNLLPAPLTHSGCLFTAELCLQVQPLAQASGDEDHEDTEEGILHSAQ